MKEREEQKKQERRKKGGKTDMKGGAEGGNTNKAPADRN